MPMTAAEKQKKYREKLKNENPAKFEDTKRKAKERSARYYQRKKSTYTEEDKQKLRQKWKEDRKKAKDEKTVSQNEPSTSQVSSKQQNDDSLMYQNIQRRLDRRLRRENEELRLRLDTLSKGFKNLQKKICRQKEKMDKMQEKYENVLAQLATTKETEDTHLRDKEEKTPGKKVTEFINNTIPNVETPKKEEVKKKLLEHVVLTESLKEQYQSANNAEKNILKKVLDNDNVKKYKQKSKIRTYLGLKSNIKKYSYQKVKSSLLKNKIEMFFNEDDVSRATAGKKEYRTFKNIKRQKRYLLDKLSILYKKFISEKGLISYSTFKKYRPFYVLSPKVKDCESCACIKHSNMQFMVDKLKILNILKSNNLDEVVADFVCDCTSKDCMYNKCDECVEKKLCVNNDKLSDETNWFSWMLKETEYTKQGEKKKTKKMVKMRKEGTLKDLLEAFNSEMKKFKTHIFNFYYQYKKYKDCINNLKDDEACIHIDFSENFTCKYHKEIQAMHFIKDQITLHTGVIYIKGEQKPISFCSISPDNDHSPEAIWTHLDPVLQYIKINHPNISTLHFFSDGPTTQYRQKKNFYFFSQKIYEYGFSYGTWSFFEAAHGKGAADGIGGVIKRTLDAKIAHGKDIPNAEIAFESLNSENTSIKIFYIPSINVSPIHTKLSPLPQTMKIHQLITKEKFHLKHRDLSCFCGDPRGNCECHSPLFHSFLNEEEPNKQTKDKKRNVRRSQKSKKARKQRRISSSTEENDSEMDIEYAESDDTVLFSDDDAMSLDNDNDPVTVHNALKEKTGILTKINPNKTVTLLSEVILKKADDYTNEEMSLDNDNDPAPATVHNAHNKKAGILTKINPNKTVKLLSEIILKKADDDTKTKQDNKRRILCENEEFIPKRSRKTIDFKKDNVTILTQIRNIPSNTVSGDLRDNNIFRKKEPFIEIKNKDSDQMKTDNKKGDANKGDKNNTKEDITKTLEIEGQIEKEYESEKMQFDTVDEDIKEAPMFKTTDKEGLLKNNHIDFECKEKYEETDKTNLNKKNEIGNLEEKEIHKESTVDEKVEIKIIDTTGERGGRLANAIERNERNAETEQNYQDGKKKVLESKENKQNGQEERIMIYSEEKEKKTFENKENVLNVQEDRDRKEIKSAKTERIDQEKETKVIKSTGNEQNYQEEGRNVKESDQYDQEKGKKTRESEVSEQKGRKDNEESEISMQSDQEQGKHMMESEENEETDFNLNINDSVIVRYFEKKTWKYYIGFVEKIEFKNGENNYKVKFLKTVKDSNTSVKFLVQRKLDIDIVTAISIVKKINLIQQDTTSKVYYLQNDDDIVFFT